MSFPSDIGATILKWTTGGRINGVIGASIGFGLIALCLMYLQDGGHEWVPLPGIVGLVLAPLGLATVVFGNPAKRSSFDAKTVEPDPRLLQHVAGRAFPYTVCLNTHSIVEGVLANACKSCRPAVHHVEVTDEEELKLALASLEPRSRGWLRTA